MSQEYKNTESSEKEKEEYLPVINEQGEILGKELRRICHNGSKILHPVVHLHVFNSKGELYLQQRSMSKDVQPGKWDTSVGGHVDVGETIEEALRREVFEELNIKDFKAEFVKSYIYESDIEKESVNTYRTIYEGDIKPNKDEINAGRFWNIDEIILNFGKEVFTPNFEFELKNILLPLIQKRKN
jgi:isopentenyldiphosphate isomerase